MGDHLLLRRLRDSRRRFQRRMRQLLEKYDQPFEDAPLVHLATLTYATPQGLRIWGGGLVKKGSKAQVQDSPEETVSRRGGPIRTPAGSHPPPAPGTCRREDPKSSDTDATLFEEDVVAGSWVPAEPQSPLENELRRKYLTQVDSLLQDEECPDDGDAHDKSVSLVPALASPAGPPCGPCGGPTHQASSPGEGPPSRPCPVHMAIVPHNDSLSLQEVSGDSFLSSQGCEADICSATLSDLYEGMLHSMSRLLSARPSCIISTKTFILQNWGSRRRWKSRVNRSACQGGRHAGRGPRERISPPSEPGPGQGALRDCGNLLSHTGPRRTIRPGRAAIQGCRLSQQPGAAGNEVTGALRPYSSWTFLDPSAGRRLDQENRFMTLKWLISPVKVVSRPRILQCEGRSHCREIEVKFEKLHREFCRSPGNQPCRALPPASSVVDVPRGGPESPGGRHSLGTHQPGTPLGKTKAKRLCEAFESLGGRPAGAGGPSPHTAPSPGCPRRQSLLFQARDLGRLRMSMSPTKALSLPGTQLSYGRARCNEIKEQFDKLHEKYQAKSPEHTKAPPRPGTSLGTARVDVRYQQEGSSRKSNSGSGFPESQKWAPSWWSLKGPLCPTPIEVRPLAWFAANARGDPPCPAKRRRLSDPQVCGRWTKAPDSWRVASGAIPRPGKEGRSVEPGLEEAKRREPHVFQDGREK
ncbi:Holliday junction recognition protein isoform X2 [Talpa occidentalis]|uniref:Holliday junction recognition protein isoform X2 n=1 Tax=Talpa occidentalis TaxID=50954 RepID=UPI00188FAD53|nr:Holliday junction recognition protein isoform X2 [Talpa occidentalis]